MEIATMVHQSFVIMHITNIPINSTHKETDEFVILKFLNTNVLILLTIKIPENKNDITKYSGDILPVFSVANANIIGNTAQIAPAGAGTPTE